MAADAPGAGATALNGKLYVVAGQNVSEYDPAGNAWTAKHSLTTGRTLPQPVTIGNLFYVAGNGAAGQSAVLEGFAPDEVSWSSSNTGEVTVDQSGLATGSATGSVQIIATSLLTPAISGQAPLTVYAPLQVTTTSPADGASAIPLNSTVTVSFNVPADASTITTNTADTQCSGTVQVSSDGFATCVAMSAGPVASNGNQSFTLTPASLLSGNTSYRIRVSTGAKDASGHALASQYTSSSGFTTNAALTVTNVSPADGSTDISVTTPVAITFNRSTTPASLTVNTADTTCSGTLQLSSDNFATCVQMSAAPSSTDSITYSVQPAAPLVGSTTYQVRVTTGVTDSDGVALSSVFTTPTGFTTAAQ
jgi:hypothetical protein